MKRVHFLSGLPRSGSTLLTVLLNQHPDIYCSQQSEILHVMETYKSTYPTFESVGLNVSTAHHESLYKNMMQAYYSEEKKPIIIDNSRSWGAPFSFDVAKVFTDEIKIIYTYRPILEVLASFVSLAHKNPETNFIDSDITKADFIQQYYRPIDDVRCDWLMRTNGQIDLSLLVLGMALKEENKHMFHIVNYDDLISGPQKVLSSIYTFLGADNYRHDFSKFKGYDNPFDGSYLGVPELHHVRKVIEKTSIPPEEILSTYVIEKYKNTTTSMGMPR